MIPLSLAWDGSRILLATPTDSPTVKNAMANTQVKAALDSADDVVLIGGTVDVVDFDSVDPGVAADFVRRVGWDPGDQPGEWSMLFVSPTIIRAWNSVAEIQGRTIMRNGEWLA